MVGRIKRSKFFKLGQKGFTLSEIMIALTVFATFAAVFVTRQAYNVSDSANLREELKLKELCEQKLGDVILVPPEYREALTFGSDKKTFEDHQNYEYDVAYTRFEVPELHKIFGDQQADSPEASAEQAVQNKVFEIIRKNLKEYIWQVEVTVTNKETGFNYTLSTWLLNEKAEVDLGFQ